MTEPNFSMRLAETADARLLPANKAAQRKPITGTESGETLSGTTKDDEIYGYGGNDTLYYGAGNNKVYGGAGNDVIDENAEAGVQTGGQNQLYGQDGNDVISGAKGNDYLSGGNGADTLSGSLGDDQIYGDSGNDRLWGGRGADTLDGGAGTDWVFYDASLAGVTVDLAQGVGLGGDAQGDIIRNVENVAGSAYGDTLTGDLKDNTLDGGIGGNDTLRGGEGSDLYIWDVTKDGQDVIEETAALGNDGLSIVSFTSLPAENRELLFTRSMDDVVVTVKGFASRSITLKNQLQAGQGIEYIAIGGLIIRKEEIAQRVAGTQVITGTSGNDVLRGGAGDETISGLAGDDTISGGEGRDVLDGGEGTDMLDFTGHGSGVFADLRNGLTSAAPGSEVIDTLTGFENVTGSSYDDVIWGDGKSNAIWGSAGNDRISGGGGRDELHGGDGIDTLDFSDAQTDIDANLMYGDAFSWIGNSYEDLGTFDGFENVIGGSAGDTLAGDNKANRIEGGGGDDNIASYDGNDTLFGGDGNDTLYGGRGADYLDGGEGLDKVSYLMSRTGVTVDLATGRGTQGDAQGDTFISIEKVFGSNYADTIIGDNKDNYILGHKGNDILKGGLGFDTYYWAPGDGNDIIEETASDAMGVLSFMGGITADDVKVTTDGKDAFYTIGGSGLGAVITLRNAATIGYLTMSFPADGNVELESFSRSRTALF